MKKIVLATVALAGFAFAAAPAAYNACKACHGVKGETNITTQNKSHIPANQTKAEIVKALNGYKDGSYGGPLKGLMKGQVARLSDADIQALADYMGK
ncbi:Cytochrome c-553 precursor [Aliarcobacter thereius]|uniref:C-type cytochrome n=2 Tax=Aliarcobacter thereius TaxID=544718 RepID=A0A1C0B8Z0_9BACT|nr:c-type cytochrome [Aliarcobacter thereius]OCL88792.1 Cytochrome c-553 precursor [Aliarcobacter thereius]OCL92287.1 Cytochrome c-553 precursor [Aliarcobacter thereius]OCL94617.1 Cytochrome c-553 precursor [Aliarcobacter thereius LMG 24486]OCM00055.1 Cytochrome c-553 precursor [Aliarcobacter thereius]QBF15506.1 periplasmic monoheme cytochrome c553 [Aliarcobacter thereius LMG 24486]